MLRHCQNSREILLPTCFNSQKHTTALVLVIGRYAAGRFVYQNVGECGTEDMDAETSEGLIPVLLLLTTGDHFGLCGWLRVVQ